MSTSFMHFRKYTGSSMHSKGGMTIAIQECGNLIYFAVSECSKHDVFCKKTGRAIAEGRLNAMRAGKDVKLAYRIIPANSGQSIKTQVCTALVELGVLEGM